MVTLPEGPQPILQICKALLGAEISIHYAYPLMAEHAGRAALALHVEDIDTAAQHLQQAVRVHAPVGEGLNDDGVA